MSREGRTTRHGVMGNEHTDKDKQVRTDGGIKGQAERIPEGEKKNQYPIFGHDRAYHSHIERLERITHLWTLFVKFYEFS